MKTFGLIGAGNMGRAILGGVLNEKLFSPENITVSDLYVPGLEALKKDYNVNTTTDSNEVAANAEAFIVALKPNVIESVLAGIKDKVGSNIVISIAAGKSIKDLERVLGSDKKIIRVMPNTPALSNEGMAALCKNDNVTDEELAEVVNIFSSFGKAEVVPEYLFDAVTGLSGSGPAYVFMFIEALADGAVLKGMPRAQAYKFAAQTVLGSAKMVMDTGKHPGELKDMVCSPGGTTIEAVKVLEEEGFRNAVIKCVAACTEKSIEMGK